MRYESDFIGAVHSRMDDIAVSLAEGKASDWAAYQRLVGEYGGLQNSLEILNNILKEDERDR